MKIGYRLFSLRHEFPNEWHTFLNPEPNKEQVLELSLLTDRFPFRLQNKKFNINTVTLFVDSNLAAIPKLSLSSPNNPDNEYTFNKVKSKYGDLFIGHPKTEWSGEDPGVWTLTNPKANAKLDKDNCRDIIAIVGYEVP